MRLLALLFFFAFLSLHPSRRKLLTLRQCKNQSRPFPNDRNSR
jgi:hypothetical protein